MRMQTISEGPISALGQFAESGSGGGIRTPDPAINSRLLYH